MSNINVERKMTLLNSWVDLVSGFKVGDFVRETFGWGIKK